MKSESTLIIETWEVVRDYVPSGKRTDVAMSFLRCFEEYGFEPSDLEDIIDEDDSLTAAYRLLWGGGDNEEEYEDGYEEL